MFDYPSFIQLNLTNKCNLKCKHCSNESGSPYPNELDDNEIFDLLEYFLSKQIVCITFGGGEPLLHPRIFDFIEYSIKRKARITLLSNGVLINEKTAIKLVDMGVSRIRISLDGSTPEINDFIRSPGSFNGATQALTNLNNAGIKDLAVMTSVNSFNISDIENIILLLIKLGIKDIKLIPTISTGRAKTGFNDYILKGNFIKQLITKKDELIDKYKKYIYISIDSPLEAILHTNNAEKLEKCGPCIIGQVFLGIKANGDIFSCPMLDSVVIGNIKKDKIEQVWRDSTILNQVRDLTKLTGKCSSCKIKQICGGGCRAMSLIYKGDITAPDPYCWKQ